VSQQEKTGRGRDKKSGGEDQGARNIIQSREGNHIKNGGPPTKRGQSRAKGQFKKDQENVGTKPRGGGGGWGGVAGSGHLLSLARKQKRTGPP